MKLRLKRARTYKLYRTTSTKVLGGAATLVLVALCLGGALPAFTTSNAHATPSVTYTVCANGCDFSTIQSAINASSDGDIVSISAGTYDAPQFLVSAGQKGVTIQGSGIGKTILNLTALSDGFKVQADGVTVKDLTLTSDSHIATYGLRPQAVTNFIVQNVEVTNMAKSGFDINGVTDSSFSNITATDNGGAGIYILDSKNLNFTDVTTSGSGWNAGIGIGVKGAANPCGTDNITFNGALNTSEVVGIYTERTAPANTTCAVKNLNVSSSILPYEVTPSKTIYGAKYVRTFSDASAIAQSPGVNAPVVRSTSDGNYYVATNFSLQDAVDATPINGTVNLETDITLSQQTTVKKALTLDGKTHTISASFTNTGNTNNSALGIQANNVTVRNLIVNGAGSHASPLGLNGINVFEATGVNLNNVTVKNNSYSGLNVNGSSVTVTNLTTENNGWHGVDVDQGIGVASNAILAIKGASTHTGELGGDIYVDNDTKGVSVVDTNSQYIWARSGRTGRDHDRVYMLGTPTTTVVPISGNTSNAENTPGWMFNRDSTGSFAFNKDAASKSNGSLYVKPLSSAVGSDKFIGELFLNSQMIANTQSVSYDFKVARNNTTDSSQFYMNVYANRAGTPASNFYDCKYDVVPTTGSTGSFTTVTFDPSKDYNVTTQKDSPTSCPSNPSSMGAGATIRAIALNVGDSTTSDAGVSGYLDNVVVKTTTAITNYDFEPATPPAAPTSPVWLSPAGQVLGSYTNINQVTPSWTAPSAGGFDHFEYSYQSPTMQDWSSPESFGTHTSIPNQSFGGSGDNATEGVWHFQVRTVDQYGNHSEWAVAPPITYDKTKPNAPNNLKLTETISGIAIPQDSSTNKADVTASWSSNNSEPVTYIYHSWYDNGSPYNAANPWPNPLTTTSFSGTFNQGDGLAHFCVIAVDLSGNQSGCSTTFNVTYDNTPPATPVLVSPHNNAVINGGSVTQSWSGDSTDTDHYIYESFNDANATSLRWSESLTTTSKSATNVGNGSVYWWRVTAVDKAGNKSTSPLWKITIDDKAPVVNITAPTDGDYIHGTVVVKGTVSDSNPDHYYLVVKNSNGTVVAGPGVVNQPTVVDWNWNTIGLGDGTYTIDLEARDAANNKDAGSSKTLTVNVDNSPPAVNINGYSTNGSVIQPDITSTDKSPLTYSWSSEPGVTLSNDKHMNPSFAVGQDGSYSFVLTVKDAAGNVTAVPFTFKYTTPPAPSSTPGTTSDTTSAFNQVATNTIGNGGDTSPVTLTNNGTGATTPEVLGDTTSSNNNNGVKGDTVTLTNSSNKSNNSGFMGLGWWWLAVIAAIFASWWIILAAKRRKQDQN